MSRTVYQLAYFDIVTTGTTGRIRTSNVFPLWFWRPRPSHLTTAVQNKETRRFRRVSSCIPLSSRQTKREDCRRPASVIHIRHICENLVIRNLLAIQIVCRNNPSASTVFSYRQQTSSSRRHHSSAIARGVFNGKRRLRHRIEVRMRSNPD